MKTKFIILVLIAGLLSACGSQPAATPASTSQPTDQPAPATQAPTSTDTAIPATATPTEEPTAEPVASSGVSFTNDILPILQSRCVNCHGGQRTEKSLNLTSYSGLIAGSENGLVTTPNDASNSLLVQMIQNGKMPKKGPKLTPPQVQLIVDWINQGALNN
jgi:mono/diheme cytochrome c family protein